MNTFRNISVRIAAAVMAVIGFTVFPVNANAETCGCDHKECRFEESGGYCRGCWSQDPFCDFRFAPFKGDCDFEFEGVMYQIISEDLKTVEIVYHTEDFTCESYEIPALVTYNDSEYRVITISSSAFSNCINLRSIYIPSTVKSIKPNSFCFCDNLETIIVDEENEYYSAENGMLFNKDKTELIACPGAEHMVIPEGVTKIADNSFYYCPKVKTVTVPATVKELGRRCFYYCPEIEAFYFYPTTPPKNNGFLLDDETPQNTPIYVPANSYDDYKREWVVIAGSDSHDRREFYYNFIPMPDTSSVESLESVAEDNYTVYSLDGKLILSTKNKSDVENLNSGIYIVNGNKIKLK